MSNFEGFIFHDPSDEQLKTTKDDEDVMNKTITDLTFQFDRINGKECKNPFETNRTSLLSNKTTKESQEKRRLIALELQKKQRQITTSKLRQMASGAITDDDDDDDDDESKDEVQSVTAKRIRDTDEDMEYNGVLTKIKKTNPNKKSKKQRAVEIYANQIMYAEYLESIPEDFVDNWVTIICPKGKRCLITSGNGQTIARSRSGHIIKRFQSILPSGSRTSYSSDFCILDCVYDAVHWTFYVLDIMCWKGYTIYDCDTSFRHFWLQTKIDLTEFDKPNGENQFYKFIALKPVFTSEIKSVANNPEEYIQQQQGFSYDIDGILFYHRQAHYIGGSTPLVCWVPRDKMYNLL